MKMSPIKLEESLYSLKITSIPDKKGGNGRISPHGDFTLLFLEIELITKI